MIHQPKICHAHNLPILSVNVMSLLVHEKTYSREVECLSLCFDFVFGILWDGSRSVEKMRTLFFRKEFMEILRGRAPAVAPPI